MDYGSERVWVYDLSDNEYVSDGELEEGMWLSEDSDDEAVTATPKPPSGAAGGPLAEDLEGSKTKYLPPEDTDDEEEEEEEPQAAGGKEEEKSSDAKKKYDYVDLELPKGGDVVKGKKEKPRGDYVKLKPHTSAPLPPRVNFSPASGGLAMLCM
jgi:hypothetical protein